MRKPERLDDQRAIEFRVLENEIINYRPATVRESLRARLGELDALCLNPLMFHSKVTFDVIDGLKDKLSYFYGLLAGDPKVAFGFWKSEVTRELKLALTAIFQESERLEANV